jgi:hypothetical protein
VIPRRSRPEERASALLRRLQETDRRHEERLLPNAPDLQLSGHAGWSRMVLHSRSEERLLAGGSASREEDCVLVGSRATGVHSNAVWPLQRLKMSHDSCLVYVYDVIVMAACSKSTCSTCGERSSGSDEKPA